MHWQRYSNYRISDEGHVETFEEKETDNSNGSKGNSEPVREGIGA
jgi:hypothetical protein